MAKSDAKMLKRIKKKEQAMQEREELKKQEEEILKIHQEYVREMETYGEYSYVTHPTSERRCYRCGYSLKYSDWAWTGNCSRGCALSMN